jgi:hypothetical protein
VLSSRWAACSVRRVTPTGVAQPRLQIEGRTAARLFGQPSASTGIAKPNYSFISCRVLSCLNSVFRETSGSLGVGTTLSDHYIITIQLLFGSCIFCNAWSRLKLPGLARGGNSLKV